MVDVDEASQGTCVSRGISMGESKADVMHVEKLVSGMSVADIKVCLHTLLNLSVANFCCTVENTKHCEWCP